MNQEELKRIYNLIIQNFTLDTSTFTFEKFSKGMSTPEGRLKFWKKYKTDLGLGDYKKYERLILTGSADEPKPIEYYKPEKRIPSTDRPDFKSKDCDENTYNWGYGCRNNKIDALNDKFFGKDNVFDGKYGDELLTKLRNVGSLGPKDTIITKEIFDKLLPNYGVVEESLIIKKTVKNILLNELLKDI